MQIGEVLEQVENELKPCPFCGGEAKTHVCVELENTKLSIMLAGYYGVHCTKCHVATTPYENEDEAIKVWNKRC